MLEQIERYLRAHAASWRIGLQPGSRLRAVLRANPDRDRAVHEFDAGQLGTVFFLFRDDEPRPIVVSKIVGAALTADAIEECRRLQESVNRTLGYPLFPTVHAVAQLNGARVVFMEAMDGPNYDIALARAVTGPERSVTALERTVSRYLRELGTACRGLRAIRLDEGEVRWGATAAEHARHFLSLYPAAASVLQERHIARMSQLIDSVALGIHPVLAEDFISNYLPGPSAVDQLVPDIRGLCAQWPGPVSGLRILLAFFRASPIHHAYDGYAWLDALAACIASADRVEIVGPAVQRYLDDIGLGNAPAAVTWSFVMGAAFLRARYETQYFAGSTESARLDREWPAFAADLVRLQDILDRGASHARPVPPQLRRDELDGEFRSRNEPDYHALPGISGPVPKWVAAVARFQYGLQRRHPRLYGWIRWLYRLPTGALERLKPSPRE